MQAATQAQVEQFPPVDHIQDVIKPQRFVKTPLSQGKTQVEAYVCESSKTTVAALGTQYPEHTVFEKQGTTSSIKRSTGKNIDHTINNDQFYSGNRGLLNAPVNVYHGHYGVCLGLT